MSDFKDKMHQIRFRLGLPPDPAGGAYSAPRPPSWFAGRFASGGGAGLGKRREGEGKGKGRGWRGKWRGG